MKTRVLLFLILAAFLSSTLSYAGGGEPTMGELMKEIRALKERVAELEAKVAVEDKGEETHEVPEHEDRTHVHDEHVFHRKGVKEMFEYEGFRIGAGGTFIVQGTPNANNAGDNEDSRVDGSYSLEIEIEKELGNFGLAYILMEPGQGDGLNNDLSLFSPVNFDAADTASHPLVTEVWYEHYFYDNQLTVTGGKLYVPNYLDANEYANDETAQFIGSMFRNSPAIDLPDDNGLGLRCNISPEVMDFLEFELVWMEENADWEDVFDHPFLSAQFNFMPAKAFDYDEEMWGGNYRMYVWYNGGDHIRLEDAEKTKERNYGFGLSCDQKITDIFGVFGRFGWQDPRVSTLEYHWSMGFQMTGSYWNRDEDVVAIAVGQAIPGSEYGDAGNPHDNETHLETYYALKLNDYLTLSPDLQMIWNPNGVGNKDDGDNDPIFVYGVRGQVGF